MSNKLFPARTARILHYIGYLPCHTMRFTYSVHVGLRSSVKDLLETSDILIKILLT